MPLAFEHILPADTTKIHIESPAHLFVALEKENFMNATTLDMDYTHQEERQGTYFTSGFNVAKDREVKSITTPVVMLARNHIGADDGVSLICKNKSTVRTFKSVPDKIYYFQRVVGGELYVLGGRLYTLG